MTRGLEVESTNEKPDKTYQPYPNKDCKTCTGKGWYMWAKDTKMEPIIRPCGCIKLIEVESTEN